MSEGLQARDITVRFGGLVALDGATVNAALGQITGLIGPNGAGKTTLFNVCCGFQRATGTVTLNGIDISRSSPPTRARLGVGRTFQRMELFKSLTVRENIELAAEAIHIGDGPLSQLGLVGGGRTTRRALKDDTASLVELVGLADVANEPTASLSSGHGRLVELARALARQPKVLLLDEPSSGLDARETAQFGALLRRVVAERGIGILLVEHDMSLVLDVCSWIHVLDFGKKLMEGSPQDVRESPLVRAAYLGDDEVAS